MKAFAFDPDVHGGDSAQHLHGGIGVDMDYPLYRYYLCAKQIELTLGSSLRQLAHIGAELADPRRNARRDRV